MVHAGPNTHPGGLNQGFDRVTYQPDTEAAVKNEPTTPVIRGIRIQTTRSRIERVERVVIKVFFVFLSLIEIGGDDKREFAICSD
jgi:hypothetical protein